MSQRNKVTLPEGAFAWGHKPGPIQDSRPGGWEFQRNEAARTAWLNALASEPAAFTVVNLMPFRLRQQISSVGEAICEACPFGEAFTTVTFTTPRMDPQELGGKKWTYNPIFPVQIAKELVGKYNKTTNNTHGAVFMYEGERKPTQEEMAAALEGRDKWAMHQYENGSRLWAYLKDPRQITPNHRVAAKLLHVNGTILDLPEWVTSTRQEQMTHANECEQCGEMNTKNAKICRECEYPIHLDWVSRNRPDLVAKFPVLFPTGQPRAKSQTDGKGTRAASGEA